MWLAHLERTGQRLPAHSWSSPHWTWPWPECLLWGSQTCQTWACRPGRRRTHPGLHSGSPLSRCHLWQRASRISRKRYLQSPRSRPRRQHHRGHQSWSQRRAQTCRLPSCLWCSRRCQRSAHSSVVDRRVEEKLLPRLVAFWPHQTDIPPFLTSRRWSGCWCPTCQTGQISGRLLL